jgi:ferritin-like metal-binding protein YciE
MKTNPSRTDRGADTENQSEDNEQNVNSELHELFLDELKDMYDAEKQLTKALPKMAKAAESDELREAFESHLEETEQQVARLEEVFQALDEKPERKTCPAMQGLVKEGEEIMKEQKGSSVLDAALIAAGQKVEHYEIATYGTLAAWAEQLGHSEVVDLLKETLDEEKAADDKLTDIAQSSANQK